MENAEERGRASRATRRQVLQVAGGAVAVGAVAGRGAAQATGQTVYVGSHDGTLYAVDAVTGTREWAFTQPNDWVNSSPTVVDGIVYVGSKDNTLYAVDAATGSQEWAFTQPSDRVQSSPTVVDGTVYVGTYTGTLYAVDAATGSQEWTFTEPQGWIISSPAVVDGNVYIGSEDSSLYAIDAATGTELWRFTQPTDRVGSSPTVANQTVYVGSQAGTLHAVDAASGVQEWAFSQPSNGLFASPAVVDGTVYVGSWDETLYAVEADTGVQRWAFTQMVDRVNSTAAVAGGTVYVGSQAGTLYAVDAASGTEEWRFSDASGAISSSPTVADGSVYVGSWDGTLYRIDTGTGSRDWRFTQPTGRVASSPTVVDNPQNGDSSGSRVSLGMLGHHSDHADQNIPPIPAFFEVTIVDVTEPPAGDTLEVSVEVTNTGGITETQTVEVVVPGIGDESTSVTLDSGLSTQEVFSLPTENGDAGVYSGTVQSEDNTDQQDMTVLEPAAFSVDITDVNEPVAGGELDVVAAVENTGDVSRTQTVELSVPELGTDSTEITLGGGGSTNVTLSLSTGNDDDGEYTATVTAADDSDEREVTVATPASFTVDITDVNEPVAGESLAVTAEIENTGDEQDGQTVLLTVSDLGTNSTEVTLSGGGSRTVTLSLSTGADEAGEYTATVESDDDSDDRSLEVLEPAAFSIEDVDVSEPVTAGEPVAVEVTVENVGEESGSETVELSAPELERDSTSVSLEPGESTTKSLFLPTESGDAQEHTVTAEVGEDETTATVTVSEPDPDDGGTDSSDNGGDSGDDTGGSGDDGSSDSGDDTGGSGDDESPDSTDDTGDSGDEASADSTDDGPESRSTDSTSGDGGLGTTEMAAIGGGGGLALLFGAYALMRRMGEDGSDETPGPEPDTPAVSDSGQAGQASPAPKKGAGATDREPGRERRGRRDSGRRADTGNTPSQIPGTSRPSLTYSDIAVGDRLGRGGNADVYHATASTPEGNLELALKEPRMGGGETLHTDVVERMITEAETWEQLDGNDNVVGVIDYGAEPLPWIAMEYMDGGHLGERADGMTDTQKLWTALSVTEGVYHAHSRGVAHRDLKPENILFRCIEDAWDAPKVADWGLSKHLLEHSKSRDGLTVEYAAPEQFSDSATTDNSTDIYQLGSVFYELFTGKPPFEGEMFAVMKQIETEQPTPPGEIADVPAGLDEILLRALSKDPADRYEDIVYLRDDLRNLFEASR